MTTRSFSLARGCGFDQLNVGRFDLICDFSSDRRVAECFCDVLLGAPDVLRFTAQYKDSRKKALLLSCGLLLGVKTFASLVQSYRETGDDVEAVLLKIEGNCIALGGRDVGENEKATVGHPGLFAAMEESLNILDEQKVVISKQSICFRPHMKVKKAAVY